MNAVRAELGVLLTTGAIQAIIQGVSFLSGLLVLRLLPLEQFAYYTIAVAVLGSLVVLADCGVIQTLLAHGGRVWQQPAALGQVVACALQLRRWMAGVALAIALPVLFLLLRHKGATVADALLITLSIVPIFLFSLQSQVYEAVLRLNQRLGELQRAQLVGNVLRVLMSVAGVVVLPLAWIVQLGAAIGAWWQAHRSRRLSVPLAAVSTPDPSVRRDMARQLGRMAPSAIYFAVAGQLNIWLLAILGRTESVAEVGALGRVTAIFNVLTAMIAMIYVPRFARMNARTETAVGAAYWKLQMGMLGFALLIVGFTAAFPQFVLLFLGPKYAGLQSEIVLGMAGGAFALMAGTAYNMSAARGRVLSPWIMVPVAALVQLGLVLLLPVSTTMGVLWLGLLYNFALWILNTGHFSVLESRHVRDVPR
jgi:O-antigen/teichoic acid export membrane protein